MKKIMFSGTLLVIAVLVIPTLVYSGPPGPPEYDMPVKVVNDSTEPVPVTGEVTATVSGDVSIVNVPGVVIENADPVPVVNKERERVYLITGSGGSFTCTNGVGAKRVLPDGSLDSSQFVVPEGKLLVLTDFGIGVREKNEYPWDSKRLIAVEVDAEPSGSSVKTVYQTSFPITSDLQEIGEAWVDRTLASGAVIGAGRYLCIKAGFGFGADNKVSMINLTKLYGYLIDQ